MRPRRKPPAERPVAGSSAAQAPHAAAPTNGVLSEKARGRGRATPDPSLAALIGLHTGDILRAWDTHAAVVAHPGRFLDARALRDDADAILARILMLVTARSSSAQVEALEKAIDHGDPTPAERHADARRLAGFTMGETVAEYAALRVNVLDICGAAALRKGAELVAFHEAVDHAMAQSARRYEFQTKAATDLFLGILAHDIRNPLSTIVLRTEFALLAGQLPAGCGEPILGAARRIKGIVEQTVDFTRLQSFGSLPVTRVLCDLGQQLAEVVEEARVRQGEGALVVEIAGDLRGCWDSGRLAQVLSNLLANAMAYGARGGTIAVRIWRDAAEACFSVHNEGAAIAHEEMQRIFEPLVRGRAAMTERRASDGLGLGLYICREIVRAHGGVLTVTSTAQVGTTFTVRVPRDAPPAVSSR